MYDQLTKSLILDGVNPTNLKPSLTVDLDCDARFLSGKVENNFRRFLPESA